VMTSPVLADSLVAVVTMAGDAIAWLATDGRELWHTKLIGGTAMGNPARYDDLLLVGIEPSSFCAINVFTGKLRYCRTFPGAQAGMGHTSVAVAQDKALITYYRIVDDSSSAEESRLSPREWLRRIVAPFWAKIAARAPDHATTMLAIDVGTGREIWRTNFGLGSHQVAGHIAGTPTVVAGVAYVPLPYLGKIAALDAATGRVLWSTTVNPARGSVLVAQDAVLSATTDGYFVVLDAATGHVQCKQKLPARSDRAGPTLVGKTAIISLRDGEILARPLQRWLQCRA
jgi:outer membrane protein assembly factor BamB